jgi:Amiloride-sensitive sodium channel
MIFALGIFSFLMTEMTSKFFEDKIILELSREEVAIKEVPFPAITICPQIFEKTSFDALFIPSDGR